MLLRGALAQQMQGRAETVPARSIEADERVWVGKSYRLRERVKKWEKDPLRHTFMLHDTHRLTRRASLNIA